MTCLRRRYFECPSHIAAQKGNTNVGARLNRAFLCLLLLYIIFLE